MNRNPVEVLQGSAVLVGGVVLLIVGAALAVCQCGAAAPTVAQQQRVGELGAALDGCVLDSPSLPAYVACRSAVLAQYGVDGGTFGGDP